MIEIKQAIDSARNHLTLLYGQPRSVQLEEVYLSDDESTWLITLSFLAEADDDEVMSGPFGAVIQRQVDMVGSRRLIRVYKSFEVDLESGTVRSMKIRPVPSV